VTKPDWSFGPTHPRGELLNPGIVEAILRKARMQDFDRGVWIAVARLPSTKAALRYRNRQCAHASGNQTATGDLHGNVPCSATTLIDRAIGMLPDRLRCLVVIWLRSRKEDRPGPHAPKLPLRRRKIRNQWATKPPHCRGGAGGILVATRLST